jgi:site-specific DNA-adenine methylase
LNGEGSTEKRPVKMLQGEFEKFFSECFHKSGEIIAKPTSHFVYLDPPYDIEPESLIPGFVSYNENGFGESHQISLAKEVHALTDMGIPVLMSNTNTSRINNLYPKSIFGYEFLEVRRSISAKSSSRGVINEVLINNYAQVGVSKN